MIGGVNGEPLRLVPLLAGELLLRLVALDDRDLDRNAPVSRDGTLSVRLVHLFKFRIASLLFRHWNVAAPTPADWALRLLPSEGLRVRSLLAMPVFT